MHDKLFKNKLRKEAYHLGQVKDPLYVLKPRSTVYELLDETFDQQISDGQAGY